MAKNSGKEGGGEEVEDVGGWHKTRAERERAAECRRQSDIPRHDSPGVLIRLVVVQGSSVRGAWA